MSVSYSLVKYVPKFGKNAGKGKFYARAQVNEKTSLKKFSKMIAMQTTVTYADVTAVLVSAVENLILELQRGNQVEFGDLGKFRLQIVSDGADSAADFKSDTHIKGVNVQYAPGPELYSVFQNMEFVQVASRAVQRAALKAEKEGAKTIDIEEVKKAAARSRILLATVLQVAILLPTASIPLVAVQRVAVQRAAVQRAAVLMVKALMVTM